MPKRRALLCVLLLLLCTWGIIPASAHALLLRSNPPSNAVLTAAPAQVELFFSEAVQSGLSTVSVLDANGKVVDLGDVRVDPTDPTRMTVSVGAMPDGVYTVVWKAISATDGHLTSGSFPFAIGTGNAAALAGQTQKTSSELPASALLSKWLLLASVALLVGQFSFEALVWRPALAEAGESLPEHVRQPPVWHRITQWALIGLFIGLAVSVLSEAGQTTGHELAWPWAQETSRVLLDSRLGVIWLGRLGLALLLVWLIQSRPTTWKRWAAFAAGLGLLLSISLTAHAATENHPALPILADWIHLTGMSFWLGGLPYLFTGLRAFRSLGSVSRTRLNSYCVERFSPMALISVGAIGVTGLYAAYLRVGTIQALYTSIYGEALLLKQVFVGLLLALAAVNLLLVSPRLKRTSKQGSGDATLTARFGNMVAGEIVLGCLLLLSVSLLTYLPPAKITPPSFALDGSTTAADLNVRIDISPGTVGQNTFTVHLTSGGQPVSSVTEALLRFTPAQSNVPPSEAQLLSAGDGSYSVKGSFLSLPSRWQVQVVVRRPNAFDAFANFYFAVLAPGANREAAAMPNIAGAVIVLDGLLFALALWPLGRRGFTPRLAGGIATVVLMAGGMFYATRPISNLNGQANPIAPSAQSIAAGQAVFEARCVVCHGQDGRGDGPLGMTLVPRPADLTIHAVPGVHTDAQLYQWITDGFPGTAMPAWGKALSDTDRWNLVNFIRTFAPKPQ